MLDFLLEYKEVFLYLSIPMTSAFVGWATNVLAIKMDSNEKDLDVGTVESYKYSLDITYKLK